MATRLDVPTDERLAALVHCMRCRVQGGAESARFVSLAFEGLAASPSTWDTLTVVQAELDDAGGHVLLAYRAVVGWLLRGVRARRWPLA